MRFPYCLVLTFPLLIASSSLSHAAGFDTYGAAPTDLYAIQPTHDFIFILGAGIGAAPAYEGASDYSATFLPIISVERFHIPGLIDVGGGPKTAGGLRFAPSVSFAGERVSTDHAALTGLDNVDATFGLGARVGYEMVLTDTVTAEVYGAARYAFGGAEGVVGEVGIDVTADVTPQLQITGGPVVSLASEGYMDTYFGVTSAQSAATGGRLAEYEAEGGIKSIGLKAEARYEFIPDTFANLKGSYSTFVGDTRNSPIVQSGSEHQFTIGLGLSRRFSF
ncbi:MAG: MipA/OmpV family protein [Candidatus Devosia phytovorans]|uniref:MipA/OmpV family protein n=1 Tax=Candidatus Devosia phytovorans TaxID=3121372 RepID=A0AAJ5VUJ0_9HYPH|nr:MipA/OmpV family protein [Devosia sp.]WEK05054.1 MAG: MipA/OmpV family protein [Devosia sp.]